jgi:Plasmid replication region DNA-binding N-term
VATQEMVNRACDAILARGERPTVDRVRTELGGGSPNRLTPLVRAWGDADRQLALPPQTPVAAVDPSNLPPTLQRAITS